MTLNHTEGLAENQTEVGVASRDTSKKAMSYVAIAASIVAAPFVLLADFGESGGLTNVGKPEY